MPGKRTPQQGEAGLCFANAQDTKGCRGSPAARAVPTKTVGRAFARN